MQIPIKHRKGIPFYYDKSLSEFRHDPYERYDPMVIRQSMVHLVDHIWGSYPMRAVLDYVECHLMNSNSRDILEIGCGVGRAIGSIASKNPDVQCWGIDYSYQMLKQASSIWIEGKDIQLNIANQGFDDEVSVESNSLRNLSFGLAKCEALPFSDHSQDLVFSSFLIDRLSDPIQALKEMKRVIRPNGKIVIVTPFNFTNQDHWSQLYPQSKFLDIMESLDFEVLHWVDDMKIYEPLDRRGNSIIWNCVGMVCR